MSQPGRIRFSTAFAVAATLTTLILLGLSVIAILAFHDINATALETRNDVLPVILERQRTAVNLERLGQFGEIVLTSTDPKRRRENLLNARILSQNAAFETDPVIHQTVKSAFQTISYLAHTRDDIDQDQTSVSEDLDALAAFHDAFKLEIEQRPADARLRATQLLNLIGQARFLLAKADADLRIATLASLKAQSNIIDKEIRAEAAGISGYTSLKNLPDILAKTEKAIWLKETIIRRDGLAANAWKHAWEQLNIAANNLSMDAANITSERFSAIAAESDHGMTIALVVLGGVVGVILLFGLTLNRLIIQPIIEVTRSLERASQTPDLRLPGHPIKELNAINRAAEGLASLTAKYARRAKELEAAQQAAELASKAKAEFLATMSHEIRTPLNTIFGITDIAMEMPLNPEQKEFCGIIQTATNRLKKVVDDILDFSKIDAGKLELEEIDFDLFELCASIAAAEKHQATGKNLDFGFMIDPAVPRFLRGDPNRLGQILGNLLDNALKFTEAGGVSLRVSPQPPKPDAPESPGICFEVADTGIGVPENKRQSIFESFSQADSSTTRKYGGTGLGLAICNQLAALMGGQLRYSPNGIRGSVFSFTAYFYPGHAPLPAQPDRAITDAARILDQPLQLLLVEDNVSNRKIIELFLTTSAANIDFAEDGEIALRKVLAGTYDLIFMDMEMPVMDGYEATRRIREWERKTGRRKTPIIALTAHAWKEHRDRAKSAGCDGFLPKPVSKSALLQCLADASKGKFPLPDDEEGSGYRQESPPRRQVPTPPDDCAVTVDPDVMDMIPHFLEAVKADALSMRGYLDKREFVILGRIGHNLKGAGQSYGFPYLSNLGRFIDDAAKDQSAPDILHALQAMEEYLNEVRIA